MFNAKYSVDICGISLYYLEQSFFIPCHWPLPNRYGIVHELIDTIVTFLVSFITGMHH